MSYLNQYLFKLIYSFFVNSWWFSYFYKYVVDVFYNFSYNVIFCVIDRGLFERMLVLNSYHNLFIFGQFFYSNNSDVSNSFFSLLIFIFGVFLFVFLSIFVLNVYLKYIFLIIFLLLLDFFSTFYLKKESRVLYFD